MPKANFWEFSITKVIIEVAEHHVASGKADYKEH